MKFSLPSQGFVFWPVGNGDSTTIVLNSETVMQVDLRHLECASDDDDPRMPILDRLVPLLPVSVYSVTATLQGFRPAKRTGVRLSVDQVVRASSGIDWTLARAVALTDKPAGGPVRAAEAGTEKPGARINRADLAQFLVQTIEDDAWIRKAPLVWNARS